MSNAGRSNQKIISAALLILGAAIFAVLAAQKPADPKSNPRQENAGARREENKKPPDATKYSYEFTQPQFYVRHILIEHDATGRGKITFERLGEETAIVEPIELSTGALGRIFSLWTTLAFLDSNENYQSASARRNSTGRIIKTRLRW